LDTTALCRLHVFGANLPYTSEDVEVVASRVYEYVWQRCASGDPFEPAAA
jgi:hypothetical protein